MVYTCARQTDKMISAPDGDFVSAQKIARYTDFFAVWGDGISADGLSIQRNVARLCRVPLSWRDSPQLVDFVRILGLYRCVTIYSQLRCGSDRVATRRLLLRVHFKNILMYVNIAL